MSIEVIDSVKKRRMGWYSIFPTIAFVLALGFHLFFARQQVSEGTMQDHIALVTETSEHFTSLFIAYGLAGIVTFAVLIFFVVYLIRLTTISAGTKIFWTVFLALLAPVSFPVFWFTQIYKGRERLEIRPGF